ncbi:MAG: nitroreductase [Gammaproteobacteria bacterium]
MSEISYAADERAALERVLRERRTVHDFQPQPVPLALVEQALDVARWAPNHHRTEPWRAYLLGPRAREAVALLNAEMVAQTSGERAAEVKLRRWRSVPGWLVLTSARGADRLREQEDYAACCCAAQNFMLALWAAGVGVKWTTGGVVRAPRFAAIVGFDATAEQVVGLFWYGWPAAATSQMRRPVDDFLVHVE